MQVSKEKKVAKYDTESQKKITTFKKTFINYLSIGYDARIGFGFDKNRCKTRCCNKFVYLWEGCKKNCCRKTVKLNKLIDAFYKVSIDPENEHNIELTKREDNGKLDPIFESETKLKKGNT